MVNSFARIHIEGAVTKTWLCEEPGAVAEDRQARCQFAQLEYGLRFPPAAGTRLRANDVGTAWPQLYRSASALIDYRAKTRKGGRVVPLAIAAGAEILWSQR